MTSSILRLEAQPFDDAASSVLPAAVGFFFAFRSFIMVLSVRLFGMDPRTGTGISLCLDYILLLIALFSTVGAARYPIGRMLRLTAIRWAVFFLGFSGLSLLWSSSASLPTSIAYWCAVAADVAIVLLLLRVATPVEVAEPLFRGYVWGACAVAMAAWIMPAQSDLRLGDEELLGPNQIGYICGFGCFFAFYFIRRGKKGFVLPSLILAITLLRSLSKTTIVAFLASGAFLLLRDKSISRKNTILITILALAVVGASWSLAESYFDIYTTAGNQSETLSGRIGIWAYFLAAGLEQPWIGHGFDSAWKVVPPFGSDQFEAAHAHNELLQQFYAYGLVGICMFAGIYTSFFRHVRKLPKGPLRSLLLALILFVLVRGGADTDRFDLSLPMWSIALLSVLIEHERMRREGNPGTPAAAQNAPLGT
jgi:exopolysaccharide production protein ExoQ